MSEGKIIKVSGPLVVARDLSGTKIYDMVRVGNAKLFGEVIEIRRNNYSIQVYEETEGIGPGEPVYSTNEPLSIELGPGLIGSIFDGIQRPLDVLRRDLGDFILKGTERPSLDREKKWHFYPVVRINDEVSHGDLLGTINESRLIVHKIMVPEGVKGRVLEISEKDAIIEETIAKIKSEKEVFNINMFQKWPVRQPRKVAKRIPPEMPLVTGQRVIDMFFPMVKGGTACVPGPFGSGKTVVQHQLAKWSDADVIVYVGCGERGNEMADVLLELPELKDPRTGESLMERTVLIANTSNMPVAAREASISTGITIAEYYRDMGYSVAVMADSTSRWAEAMREMSGRLEEMPGEEGFPSYLGSRLASFYERSGNVICLGSDDRRGSVSIIGAVSPPGGDLSEPVTQATLRVVKVFWGLDDKLASQRHFPAIDWMTSYSLYHDVIDAYASKNVNTGWKDIRREAMELLKKESELEELIRFVGIDTLSENDRLIMEVSRMIREDFLRQNAYDTRDTYTSLRKEYLILDLIMKFYSKAKEALKSNVELDRIMCILSKQDISSAEFIPEDQLFKFEDIERKMTHEIDGLIKKSLGT
jgi:V/A-type H+/Na+-transporting ATPase subunit A